MLAVIKKKKKPNKQWRVEKLALTKVGYYNFEVIDKVTNHATFWIPIFWHKTVQFKSMQ